MTKGNSPEDIFLDPILSNTNVSSVHEKVKLHLFLRTSGMIASDKSKYPYSKSMRCSVFLLDLDLS